MIRIQRQEDHPYFVNDTCVLAIYYPDHESRVTTHSRVTLSHTITLLVKVSQGHNYQIATNKTCMAHEVLFLQIVHMSGQTAANKLSTGHRVLFLQIVHASGETGANKLSMGYGSLFL